MTTAYPLPRETRQTAILDGNGTTGPYGPTAFKVFDVLDVKVWRKDAGDAIFADVTATSTIAKTADLAYDTVSVTLATAAPDTTDIVIQAARRAERSASVLRGASIDGDQLEKELTKLASTHSEMRRDLDRRPAFQLDHDGETALPAWEASKALAWHATQKKLVNIPLDEAEVVGAVEAAQAAAALALGYRNDAEDAADLAGLYANEDEDVEVPTASGDFSARHFLAKITALKAAIDAIKAELDVLTIATAGEYASATAGKLLTNASVWGDLGVLTDGATIALDFNIANDFGGAGNAPLALGGDRTLGAPTNARNLKKGIVWFTASGSTRTLTLNAAWVLATGVEAGPYSITTSQVLGVAYVTRGTTVVVTGIVRTG